MFLKLCFSQALANLFSSKLRSFLAILGVVVGTASVVAMISCGKLATHEALKQFKSLGTNLLAVSLEGSGDSTKESKKWISVDEALALNQVVPFIQKAAPYIPVYDEITFKGQSINGSTVGITQNLSKIIHIDIQRGRPVMDFDGSRQFAVIGKTIYEQIKKLGKTNPLGSQIQIGTEVFTIVGIASSWETSGFFYQDVNESVLIPIKATYVFGSQIKINHIVFRLEDTEHVEITQRILERYFTKLLPNVRLYFRNPKEIINSLNKQYQIFTLLLGMIGGISLLVGGIGVMNIMLVSVSERKREIGIRKALGARRKDIQNLFLMESIALSLFGGVIGVIFGVFSSYFISLLTHWEFFIFILPPVIGFLVSVGTGIFFGFYPAYRASKLDPIETLRSE